MQRIAAVRIAAYLVWGLAPALAASTAHAVPTEIAVRDALKRESGELIRRGDFAGYVARAEQLRTSRERTPAGIWSLGLFYKGATDFPSARPDAPEWARLETAARSYVSDHPTSAPAVIALAELLDAHAWTYRGGQTSDRLADEQVVGFRDYLERARLVLDGHRKVAASDPEWYALRISVANGRGEPRSAIMELVRAGLDVEPTYQRTLYEASFAFQPKWGGSRDGFQAFLALALERSASEEGTQAYARVVFNVARSDNAPRDTLLRLGVEWPRLNRSLDEIDAAYPDPWNLNIHRAMSCLMGTEQDLKSATARVGERPESVAWFDREYYWAGCQQQQKPTPRAALGAALDVAVPAWSAAPAALGGMLAVVALTCLVRRPRRNALQTSYEPLSAPPSTEPHVYTIGLGWRVLLITFGGALAVGAAIGLGFLLRSELVATTLGLALAAGAAALGTGGALMVIDTLQSRVALFPDRLEIRELWRVRTVSRADIASHQIVQPPNGPRVLKLWIKGATAQCVKVPILWFRDPAFTHWFAGIPDTEELAARQLEQEIAQDETLGASAEERLARAGAAERWTAVGNGVAGLLAFWAWIYPRPFAILVVLLSLAPLAAIALMARLPAGVSLGRGEGRARPDLTPLLALPGIALAVRAYLDVYVTEWLPAAFAAVIGSAVMVAVVVWATQRARQTAITYAAVFLLLLPYGYGVTVLLNTQRDRVRSAAVPVQIESKWVSGGRWRRLNLGFTDRGPVPRYDEVTVTADRYALAAVGDTWCRTSHLGALGIPWSEFAPCAAP